MLGKWGKPIGVTVIKTGVLAPAVGQLATLHCIYEPRPAYTSPATANLIPASSNKCYNTVGLKLVQ